MITKPQCPKHGDAYMYVASVHSSKTSPDYTVIRWLCRCGQQRLSYALIKDVPPHFLEFKEPAGLYRLYVNKIVVPLFEFFLLQYSGAILDDGQIIEQVIDILAMKDDHD